MILGKSKQLFALTIHVDDGTFLVYVLLTNMEGGDGMGKDIQDQDFQWFLDNYDSLFEQYGNKYLAIKDKKIIGVYKTYAEGVKETQKTEELGSFIIQHCNGDESGYTNYISSMNFMGAVG